jgi:hypothetical protein
LPPSNTQKAGERVDHKARYQQSSGFVAGWDGFNPATNHYNGLSAPRNYVGQL